MREGSVPGDLPRPAPIRVYDPKDRSLALCDGYQGYPSKKGGSTGYDGYKKVKGNKLSALVDRNGLPLACTVAPANAHDSRLYEPTLEAFEIPEVQDHPTIISADAPYDAREIRQYNRKQGIKSNIPVNRRSRRHPKRGRPFWFDPELYKKRSAVERFFSWIEAFKKITPRYECYEHSFLGLIYLACSVMIGRILG
jgi:transposase